MSCLLSEHFLKKGTHCCMGNLNKSFKNKYILKIHIPNFLLFIGITWDLENTIACLPSPDIDLNGLRYDLSIGIFFVFPRCF